MTARMAFYAIAALLGLGAIAAATLFFLQNAARTTQLSIDLYFMAWQLGEPVAVNALIGLSFASGLGLGGLIAVVRGMSSRRQIKQLEQQIALDSSSASFR